GSPTPSVALDVTGRHLMFTQAVVGVVGIEFVVGVVLHDSYAANIAHDRMHGGFGLEKEIARHPLTMFGRGEISAGNSRANFHRALQLPVAGKVVHLLMFRTREKG